MLGTDQAAVTFHVGILYGVSQLSHIARPGILCQQVENLIPGGENIPVEFLCGKFQEVFGQHGDIKALFPERRKLDWNHAQSVEQISAELLFREVIKRQYL